MDCEAMLPLHFLPNLSLQIELNGIDCVANWRIE